MSASSGRKLGTLFTTSVAKRRCRLVVAVCTLGVAATVSPASGASLQAVESDSPGAPTGSYTASVITVEPGLRASLEAPSTAPAELPWRPSAYLGLANAVDPASLELGLRVAAPPRLPSGLSERHLRMAHETAAFLVSGRESDAMLTWRRLVLSGRQAGLLSGAAEISATSLWILREAFVEPRLELRWLADVFLTHSSQEAMARVRLAELRSGPEPSHGHSELLVEDYLDAAASASDAAASDLLRAFKKHPEVLRSITFYNNLMTMYDPEVRFTD